jgi:hypothetical protein
MFRSFLPPTVALPFILQAWLLPSPLWASDELETALRRRVTEYYSLMQVGRWADAKELITAESRDTFLIGHKGPFAEYSIKSVTITADKKATVVVKLLIPTGMSVALVPVERSTTWRLVQNEWYLELPQAELNPVTQLYRARPGGAAKSVPPALEVRFKSNEINIGKIEPDHPTEARFEFTNVTDHPVTLEVFTSCECLTVKGLKRSYAPGELGEFTLVFDPANYKERYIQTIVVTTQPGGSRIFVDFRAYVIPRRK